MCLEFILNLLHLFHEFFKWGSVIIISSFIFNFRCHFLSLECNLPKIIFNSCINYFINTRACSSALWFSQLWKIKNAYQVWTLISDPNDPYKLCFYCRATHVTSKVLQHKSVNRQKFSVSITENLNHEVSVKCQSQKT